MKKYKPTSPGRRDMTGLDYSKLLSGDKKNKKLTSGKKRSVGRNAFGRITTRHKGGGAKRAYRQIDFAFDKRDIPFTIESIEYDPNRTGFIGIALYADGERRYTLLPQGVEVGTKLLISEKAPAKPGNRLPLEKLPIGTFVFNVEIKPGSGAKLVRSAGNYAEVLAKDAGYVDLKMPSGEVRKILQTAWASVGEVSNNEQRLVTIGKAGRNRHKGVRPTVRGAAMNAVDHPMGGGEARGRGSRPKRKTRQGKLVTPGVKTRTPKKYSNHLISSRRKSKKRR
jgi:large subunit ribosomal protein L2